VSDQAIPLDQLRDAMPFAALVGVELVEAGPELVRARLAWTPAHCTAGGVMHGGALMAFADTCGGVCAFLNLPDGASATATVESHTHFLRAVRDGTLTAGTRPLRRAKTLIVLETEIAREDGALVAKVTQTQIFK
jgi:1,4-dihydroxy-2-naphthoyl-CoA hydrolase